MASKDFETVESIKNVDISKGMRESYLQYSMSVIVGRALPDVRDGLKPVHRRTLYAMYEMGNFHNKPYKKSARIVGDVIGKYHPHGEMAVYEAIVRMAQSFSLRYPLIDGQGNFGSIDGDTAAAQRYTEIRTTSLTEELLKDLEKKTVSWHPNYDDSLFIPQVLPSKFPHLLTNGSSGIAVGMATNIPPHNLSEVIDACVALIENPSLEIEDLMQTIQGPDFPTAGVIIGKSGIISAYKRGRGIITIRAVAEIVSVKEREKILITELPYQVNKARLIENMASLVRDKRIEGISDIRDESSREGMRVVLQIKRNFSASVVLNRLYKYTQMQVSFGIIMLALDSKNQPKTFNLKSILEAFIEHRRDVITKRCLFELEKSEDRVHILSGLKKALEIIDEVISEIQDSKKAKEAENRLIERFYFSRKQSQAILDMKLQRLTGLEQEKILEELKSLEKRVEELKKILSDSGEIFKIITEELKDIKERYGDKRRTLIEEFEGEIQDEDLILKEESIVTLTRSGSIKRTPLDQYRVQKRGGKGVKGAETKEEDFFSHIFYANTLTSLLIFSDQGKVYWQKVYRLPQGSRTSKGQSIANLVHFSKKENVRAILPVDNFLLSDHFIIMLTEKGVIKKTSLGSFQKPRSSGLIALRIDQDDNLMTAKICKKDQDIFIVTRQGMSIRFDQDNVRAMGRVARGVRGVLLGKEDKVVGMEVVPKSSVETILIVTEGGYGKRTRISEYRVQSRGGVGVITQKTNKKVGALVAAHRVEDENQVVITTNKGQMIRMKCMDISIVGRNTQGVRLIHLKSGEYVTGVALLGMDDVKVGSEDVKVIKVRGVEDKHLEEGAKDREDRRKENRREEDKAE